MDAEDSFYRAVVNEQNSGNRQVAIAPISATIAIQSKESK
jgi:hypothetical protein